VSFPGGDPLKIPIDPNGNLASKTEGSDTWGYEWDAENQLKRVTKNGAEVARFAYDAFGRRVEKVVVGVVHGYSYDGHNILRETGANGTVFDYVHGPGIDDPLAGIDQTGVPKYFHADWLGSIVRVTDSAGTVIDTRQYDAWGNLEIGADQSGFAFTGREWDREIDLYYYRARYYNPRTGRFVAEDPMGFRAGINFYAYALGDPVGFIDPMGLEVQVCYRQMRSMFEGPQHSVIFPTSTKPTKGPGSGKCIASGLGPKKGIGWQGGAIHDEEICDEYGNYNPEYQCSAVSKSNCVEECVKRKIAEAKKKPPAYRPGPRWAGGRQCTDWSDDTMAACNKECGGK
jgi:RHS repeat-associated protein